MINETPFHVAEAPMKTVFWNVEVTRQGSRKTPLFYVLKNRTNSSNPGLCPFIPDKKSRPN
ncbi:MAG: hypothetical protein CSYNP_00897 [Syntrophus sp. SKADARSKE-3]|nr:hypothetical protein [Syntrophus sp. SKADARSKE-3]